MVIGFKIIKWSRINCAVLASLPSEERAKDVKELDLDRETLPDEKALRIQWDVQEDTLSFRTAMKAQPITRKGIALCDPLGFFRPDRKENTSGAVQAWS